MGNMTTLFIFVICFNLIMWMTQLSMTNINPDSTLTIIGSGSSGDTVGQYKDRMDSVDPTNELPGSGSTVQIDTGNVFTDIFYNIRDFFMNTLGLGYVVNMLKAPYYFLSALGLPAAFVGVIGSAWYAISFLVVVVFFFRGSD